MNDVRSSPPSDTDCEPLPPVSELPPNSIWSRTQITQLQQALAETCPSISFDPTPDIWSQSILTDIQNKILSAWCDCEPDDHCPGEIEDPTFENGLTFDLFTQTKEVFSNCGGKRPAPTYFTAEELVADIHLQPGVSNRSWRIVGLPASGGPAVVFASGIVECSGNLFVMSDSGNIADATGSTVFCGGPCDDLACVNALSNAESNLGSVDYMSFQVVISALSAGCDCLV